MNTNAKYLAKIALGCEIFDYVNKHDAWLLCAWDYFAQSGIMTEEVIKKYGIIDKLLFVSTCSSNLNVSLDFVLEHVLKDFVPTFGEASEAFDLDEALSYGIPWNYMRISRNPNLKVRHLLHDNLYKTMSLDWISITTNPGITFDDMKMNPNLYWIWIYVVANPNFIPEIHVQVLKQMNVPINYNIMSHNPNLTSSYILKHSSEQWNWADLAKVIIIEDIKHVTDNTHLLWHMPHLSRNPSVTIEMILASPKLSWDFNYVSINPNLRLQHIVQNPSLPWNYESLSRCPGLTFHEITYTLNLMGVQPYIDVIGNNKFSYQIELYSSIITHTINFSKESLEKIVQNIMSPKHVVNNLNKFKYHLGTEQYN